MVALKEEYTTQMAFQAGGGALATVSLRPVRQTLWRRKHEIRAGAAPHFYTGAMSPELPLDDEIRVGYRNRVDDPSGKRYEYIGFAYRGYVQFKELPLLADVTVVQAELVLRIDETLWQTDGQPASEPFSAATQLLLLEAPLQAGDAAFYTPSYPISNLPNRVGAVDKAAFTLHEGLKIDVTKVVQAWMRGQARNYGFMLVGPDESFAHNNDVQESTYGETILTVVYTLQK